MIGSWAPIGTLGLMVHRPATGRGGLILQITPMRGLGYDVIVVETIGENGPDGIAEHSHAMKGPYPEIREAMDAAELYARRWLAGELDQPAACDCGPIGGAP